MVYYIVYIVLLDGSAHYCLLYVQAFVVQAAYLWTRMPSITQFVPKRENHTPIRKSHLTKKTAKYLAHCTISAWG